MGSARNGDMQGLTQLMLLEQPQFGDHPQDIGEPVSRNGDLRHLEDVATDSRIRFCETILRPLIQPANVRNWRTPKWLSVLLASAC
jgi:hypothetical protein